MSEIIPGMCNYCGTGCSLDFHVDDDGSVKKVTGAKGYTANSGSLCPKGFKILDPINSPDRGLSPLVRDANGVMQEKNWDEVSDIFVERIKNIQKEHGNKSVAFISTGQLFLEEFSVLGMLRGIMDIEGDGNTRQCMASAVVGYKQAFGFDAPPFTYEDMEESDCIILCGSNMAIAHPIIFERYKKRRKDDHDLIVIDPRKTETAEFAHLHVAIKPKRDLILFYTLANELIKSGRSLDNGFIEKNTENFESFKEFVKDFSRENIEKDAGISLEVFDSLVKKVETRKKVTFWWTMGVNQSHQAVRTVQAMINICLMTGNIGRPGTGPCSVTGQTNAMGSRLFSNTTALFGGRDFTNEKHRDDVSRILGIPDSFIPAEATLPYDKIIDGIDEGKIKALWIICTNPLHTWINSSRIQRVLKEKLDLLVVQDLFPDTLSAKQADIFLPAAGISEKQGILVNSERRLGATFVAKKAPGIALSDYNIFLKLGMKYGDAGALDKWQNVEMAFERIKELSEGMPCDITGIKNHEYLTEMGGIQWPYPASNLPEKKQRRLFEDHKFYTASQKAQFLFADFEAPSEEPDVDYPFSFLSGRGSIFQFHTMTRTGRSAVLAKQYPVDRPYIEINTEDAKRLNISQEEKVQLTSRRGTFIGEARIGEVVKEGFVFVPMHFEGVNELTKEAFDPYSREPSFKTGAVKLEKCD